MKRDYWKFAGEAEEPFLVMYFHVNTHSQKCISRSAKRPFQNRFSRWPHSIVPGLRWQTSIWSNHLAREEKWAQIPVFIVFRHILCFYYFASHFEKYWNVCGSSESQRLRTGFRHLALPEQITGKPRPVGAANKMEGKRAGRGLGMMTDSCG